MLIALEPVFILSNCFKSPNAILAPLHLLRLSLRGLETPECEMCLFILQQFVNETRPNTDLIGSSWQFGTIDFAEDQISKLRSCRLHSRHSSSRKQAVCGAQRF